jgi:hypothetical protein
VSHLHTIESQLNFSQVSTNEVELDQLLQD